MQTALIGVGARMLFNTLPSAQISEPSSLLKLRGQTFHLLSIKTPAENYNLPLLPRSCKFATNWAYASEL